MNLLFLFILKLILEIFIRLIKTIIFVFRFHVEIQIIKDTL
jgi:hypothetical protein